MTRTEHHGNEAHHQLFAPLTLLLTRSELAYQIYLEKRVFLNALRLHRINRRIVSLLHSQAGLIPPVLIGDVASLLNHYECWLIQFSQHRREVRPAMDSLFIFPTIDQHNSFPKSAVAHIIDEAKSLC